MNKKLTFHNTPIIPEDCEIRETDRDRKKLIFHADAGHAWLEVEITELTRLGIADKISGYSYKRGSKAYLEEDCDAALYINKLYPNGLEAAGKGRADIREIYDGDNSPIRNYERYK